MGNLWSHLTRTLICGICCPGVGDLCFQYDIDSGSRVEFGCHLCVDCSILPCLFCWFLSLWWLIVTLISIACGTLPRHCWLFVASRRTECSQIKPLTSLSWVINAKRMGKVKVLRIEYHYSLTLKLNGARKSHSDLYRKWSLLIVNYFLSR